MTKHSESLHCTQQEFSSHRCLYGYVRFINLLSFQDFRLPALHRRSTPGFGCAMATCISHHLTSRNPHSGCQEGDKHAVDRVFLV